MIENGIEQQPSCYSRNHSGYFGKPTKLRTQEPNMYEILSWCGDSENQNRKQKPSCQKCAHSNNEHVPQNTDSFKPKNYGKQEPKKSHFQDSRHQKDNSKNQQNNFTQSRTNLAHQASQKNLAHERPGTAVAKSRQKQRPHSANNTKPRQSSAHDKVKAIPNYMKPSRHETQTGEEKENRLAEEQDKKIQKFVQTTRWIPNSAFTTYFGKPAFQNYGRGNTKPTTGGLLYGNYLKSHNVQPHRGQNNPAHIQSYSVALMKAKEIGEVYPYPPKMNKKDMEMAQKEYCDQIMAETSPICAQKTNINSFPIKAPVLTELEKFGGRGIAKMSRTRFSAPFQVQKRTSNHAEW